MYLGQEDNASEAIGYAFDGYEGERTYVEFRTCKGGSVEWTIPRPSQSQRSSIAGGAIVCSWRMPYEHGLLNYVHVDAEVKFSTAQWNSGIVSQDTGGH